MHGKHFVGTINGFKNGMLHPHCTNSCTDILQVKGLFTKQVHAKEACQAEALCA